MLGRRLLLALAFGLVACGGAQALGEEARAAVVGADAALAPLVERGPPLQPCALCWQVVVLSYASSRDLALAAYDTALAAPTEAAECRASDETVRWLHAETRIDLGPLWAAAWKQCGNLVPRAP